MKLDLWMTAPSLTSALSGTQKAPALTLLIPFVRIVCVGTGRLNIRADLRTDMETAACPKMYHGERRLSRTHTHTDKHSVQAKPSFNINVPSAGNCFQCSWKAPFIERLQRPTPLVPSFSNAQTYTLLFSTCELTGQYYFLLFRVFLFWAHWNQTEKQ